MRVAPEYRTLPNRTVTEEHRRVALIEKTPLIWLPYCINGNQGGFVAADRRPRLALTLSDEARDVVERLAELEGTSMTKVVSGIVDAFVPTARQLVEALEAARNLPEERRQRIAALAESMTAELLEQAESVQADFSDVFDAVKDAARD